MTKGITPKDSEELIRLKEKKEALDNEVKTLETAKSQGEGKLDGLFDQLEQNFGVSSIDDAENLLEEKKTEVEKLKKDKVALERDLDMVLADHKAEE